MRPIKQNKAIWDNIGGEIIQHTIVRKLIHLITKLLVPIPIFTFFENNKLYKTHKEKKKSQERKRLWRWVSKTLWVRRMILGYIRKKKVELLELSWGSLIWHLYCKKRERREGQASRTSLSGWGDRASNVRVKDWTLKGERRVVWSMEIHMAHVFFFFFGDNRKRRLFCFRSHQYLGRYE